MAIVYVHTTSTSYGTDRKQLSYNANSLSLETNLCDGTERRLALETNVMMAGGERIYDWR